MSSSRRPGAAGMGRRTVLKATALAAGGLMLGRPGRLAAADAPSEIRIGATISQSGVYQGIVGPFRKLMEVWAERVNQAGGIPLSKMGKSLPIRLIVYDDKSEAPTALSLYERLATVDRVDLFIGPFSSGLNNAAIQAALTHRIPFFIPEGTDAVIYDTPNPWRAGCAAPAQDEWNRLVELYAAIGQAKTVAVLARDNLHEVAAAQGFADGMKKRGFTIVYNEVAPQATKDFSSILLKIKASNPDLIALESIAPPFNIQFLKQAQEQGVGAQDILLGHGVVPVLKALGPASENLVSLLWSFEGDTADHQEFHALCAAAGFEPWQYSEAGIRFATFKRVENALKQAGSLDHEAVRAAMWNADFPLFGTERMKIDAKGYGTLIPYPTQAKGGKYVSLWPIEKGLKVHTFKNAWS